MLAAKSEVSGAASNRAAGLTANQKIDVCRGLFAFLVVAAHSVDMSWSIHPEARTLYPWWLHDLLLYVAAAGIHWVIGFFVISGYCIQLSVSRSIDGNSFPLARYLAARLSRILPIYYLGLMFAVFVERLNRFGETSVLGQRDQRKHASIAAIRAAEPDRDVRHLCSLVEYH